jgi:L-asparaginase
MSIAIVLLGGTISYSDSIGFSNQFINELLKQSRIIGGNYRIYNFNEGDSVSLFKNADKMKQIIKNIQQLDENNVLILVGTDRMVEISKTLSEKIKNKRLILTGAMIPYHTKIETDSLFNFGYALASLQHDRQHGTWIAMNGTIFSPYKARKNYSTRTFEIKK